MVEATTRWLETHPVHHATTQNTILGLEKQVLWQHGTPERTESDNGTHFRNNLIDTWAKEHGIEWVYPIPCRAPASGKIERYNGLLKTTLRAMDGGMFKHGDTHFAKATCNNLQDPDVLDWLLRLGNNAKQPQFPQLLLIRLVLQTLHQLRCPSLDTLQHLNVSLVVRGPKLNTVFETSPSNTRYLSYQQSRDTQFFQWSIVSVRLGHLPVGLFNLSTASHNYKLTFLDVVLATWGRTVQSMQKGPKIDQQGRKGEKDIKKAKQQTQIPKQLQMKG
ncbi:hypothetical protein QYF61_023502, partial [Mycteria americana]